MEHDKDIEKDAGSELTSPTTGNEDLLPSHASSHQGMFKPHGSYMRQYCVC